MVTPYLEAKQGWKDAALPPRRPAPDPRADPRRGGLPRAGDRDDRAVHRLHPGRGRRGAPRARRRRGDGRDQAVVLPAGARPRLRRCRWSSEVWKVLEAFASFGFCKAHAAAFALPTYQSAWLKAHYPAHFLAGVLTHDPGMYPKRLILDDARQFGIAVLGLDVNASEPRLRRRSRCLDAGRDGGATASGWRWPRSRASPRPRSPGSWPRRPYQLAHRLLAPRPGVPARWSSGWCSPAGSTRSTASASPAAVRRRGRVTRRDLLLQVAELDRYTRAAVGPRAARGSRPGRRARAGGRRPGTEPADRRAGATAPTPPTGERAPDPERHPLADGGVWAQRPRPVAGDPAGRAGQLGPARPRPRRRPGRRRGQRAAGDDRRRAGARRAGDPRPRRRAGTSSTSTTGSSTRSG